MSIGNAKFSPGELVHHKLFDYRGVVVDVDPTFRGSEEWYTVMARSRPPKDRPWYHVLVDGSDVQTYVAERNLEPDGSDKPITHPLVDDVFETMEDGRYIPVKKQN